MLPLILFMTLVGGVLGLRFRVFVLGPVIAAACLVIALGGMNLVAPQASTVVLVIAVATALQVGYLCGLFVRQAVAAARLPKTRLEATGAKSRA